MASQEKEKENIFQKIWKKHLLEEGKPKAGRILLTLKTLICLKDSDGLIISVR